MQSINVVVLNRWFLGVFLGTALACTAVAVWAVAVWQPPRSAAAMAGSIMYLVGTFGVTMRCNVPLNDGLARADGTTADGVRTWDTYLRAWTVWNHVRTTAALVAAWLLILAA